MAPTVGADSKNPRLKTGCSNLAGYSALGNWIRTVGAGTRASGWPLVERCTVQEGAAWIQTKVSQ
jgi:hypothetical protein